MSASEPVPSHPQRHLRLADLPHEHLAGDGNWLWKIPFDGGFGVLKVYTGNRHPLLHVKKTLGNRVLTGRTSHMPRARRDYEVACVALWARHGFGVFGMHPEVVFDDLPAGTYMLYDYTEGTPFREHFRDESLPLATRLATWRRFLPEWHRRHRLAIDLSEPRLIHENGDCKHVLIQADGRFVSFDFEVGFRSRQARDLVGREILAYLRSFGRAMSLALADELVAHYPEPELLWSAWEHAFRNGNPLVRAGRALDYRFKRRDGNVKGRFSKYRAALELERRLRDAGVGGRLRR